MEAKFFSEIEKKMDVKTIKDFEKEVRSKYIMSWSLLERKMIIFLECEWLVNLRCGKKSEMRNILGCS